MSKGTNYLNEEISKKGENEITPRNSQMPNVKCKTQNRGITLVALIITVIVLLILAGTAISIAVNGGDIFSRTAEARNQWNSAVANEEQKIKNAFDIIYEFERVGNDKQVVIT